MKAFSKILAIAAAMAGCVFAASCDKTEEIKAVPEVKVHVTLPTDFPSAAAYTGEVILTDRTTGESQKTNAVAGTATFTKVPYGIYSVSAAQVLTSAEFKALAPELGKSVTSDVALNSNTLAITLTAESDVTVPFNVNMTWNIASSLLISRIYNFGTLNLASKAYSNDKFIEIYNNSAETQYIDGLGIAEVYPSAVGQSAFTDVTSGENVYIITAAMFPGSGKDYPVEPGKSIVLAQNAMNHINADVITNTADLSGADFECYVEGATSQFPADNAKVPNMKTVFTYNQYLRFFVTNGAIYALFKMSEADLEACPKEMVPGSDAYGAAYATWCKKIPASCVIDGVDLIREGYESRGGRHFPDAIDASNAVINQKNITLRKILYVTEDGRAVLQDTNNSANDFVKVESVDGNALKIRDYSNSEIQPK